MTRIVDTTIRLLSQQPLVTTISTSRLLEVAEILDTAGFASLEVTGGGCFEAAVQRGVESPWERVRALKSRCSRTPLQMAVRGRFLVGAQPLSDDLVRRFILVAAESGIDIFRLHDPLNDVENIASAAAAVREAGCRLYAGLAFSGYMPNLPRVVEKARRLADMGADHLILNDPAGALDPGTCDRVIGGLREAAGLPVGLYCQGTGGNALAMAIESARARRRADRRRRLPGGLVAAPSSRPRCCATRLSGLGLEHGVDQGTGCGGLALHRRARHLADAGIADPAPDHASHRAQPRCRWGWSPISTPRLRVLGAPDRLDEVLEEFKRVRMDCGMPPLAQPVGGVLAGQAVRHVLSARRWAEVIGVCRWVPVPGAYGPRREPIARRARPSHATTVPPPHEQPRHRRVARREGNASPVEEDLLLVALFGDERQPAPGPRCEAAVTVRIWWGDHLDRSEAARIREADRPGRDLGRR